MRTEEKVTVIPERIIPAEEIKEITYTCEICGTKYGKMHNALTCEARCLTIKKFTDAHKPKYELGSLIQTVDGELYVIRRCKPYFDEYTNGSVGYAYATDYFVDEDGEKDDTHIRENAIAASIKSKDELFTLIADGHLCNGISDIVVNHADKCVEFTIGIGFESIISSNKEVK